MWDFGFELEHCLAEDILRSGSISPFSDDPVAGTKKRDVSAELPAGLFKASCCWYISVSTALSSAQSSVRVSASPRAVGRERALRRAFGLRRTMRLCQKGRTSMEFGTSFARSRSKSRYAPT